jgi:hypothetical protein
VQEQGSRNYICSLVADDFWQKQNELERGFIGIRCHSVVGSDRVLGYLNLHDRNHICKCIKYVVSHTINYQHALITFANIIRVAL